MTTHVDCRLITSRLLTTGGWDRYALQGPETGLWCASPSAPGPWTLTTTCLVPLSLFLHRPFALSADPLVTPDPRFPLYGAPNLASVTQILLLRRADASLSPCPLSSSPPLHRPPPYLFFLFSPILRSLLRPTIMPPSLRIECVGMSSQRESEREGGTWMWSPT